MRFTIIGHHEGKPASITWDDGELSGDSDAVEAFKSFAAGFGGIEVIGMGIISESDHVSKPLPASMLLYEFLDPVTKTKGRVPRLPRIPPGAVS